MQRLFILFFLLWAGVASAGSELVMFEEHGCFWCARWNREIAPIYPKTAEGRLAPLRRLDIHGALPEEIALDRKPVYTPTFVLLIDGQEAGRIEGYPGDEFFWFLLTELLHQAGLDPDASG